jgi:hypothetical protein
MESIKSFKHWCSVIIAFICKVCLFAVLEIKPKGLIPIRQVLYHTHMLYYGKTNEGKEK